MAIMGFANGKPKLLFIAPDKNDAGHIYQILLIASSQGIFGRPQKKLMLKQMM